jgi:hypothetical protein
VTFRFDWQAEPDGFLKWLLPVVIPVSQKADLIEQLSAATDKFTNVELTIQVNGIQVDAQAFLTAVERNMDHSVSAEARRLLDEIGKFEDLHELLRDAERAARRSIEQRLTDAGFELPDSDHGD